MKPCGRYSGPCAATARTPRVHHKTRTSDRRIGTSRGWTRIQDAPTLRRCTPSVDPEVAVFGHSLTPVLRQRPRIEAGEHHRLEPRPSHAFPYRAHGDLRGLGQG